MAPIVLSTLACRRSCSASSVCPRRDSIHSFVIRSRSAATVVFSRLASFSIVAFVAGLILQLYTSVLFMHYSVVQRAAPCNRCHALPDGDPLKQGSVDVEQARAAQRTAPHVAERA